MRSRGILILSGPIGTQLEARGFKSHPILWTGRAVEEAPQLLKQIHIDYLLAGSQILTANTFRTSSYTAEKAGYNAKDAERWTKSSVALAKAAVLESGVKAEIVGSIGPLEDCYRPEDVPSKAVLKTVHAQSARWLKEAGCETVLLQTMGVGEEASTAVEACLRTKIKNVWVSFIIDDSGARLLGGESLKDAAHLCVDLGAGAILLNCRDSDLIERGLSEISNLKVRLGAYANAQKMRIRLPGQVEWFDEPQSCESYAVQVKRWIQKFGVSIVGSCCGTSPLHIKAISRGLRQV